MKKRLSVFLLSSIIIIIISVLISGCMTRATKQALEIRSNMTAIDGRWKACNQNIEDNPAYQNLFSHMPRISRVTPMQLADETIPNETDVKDIITSYNEIAQCRKQIIEETSMVAPPVVTILVETYQNFDLITADLIGRKITWGEANKRRVAVDNERRSKLTAEGKRVFQELKTSHKAELAQWHAVGEVLLEWTRQQQAMNNQRQLNNTWNRTVTTNCERLGNYVSCTTY